MPRISESIPDLLGGVSQLAPQRREVNEVESMVNCNLRPAEGVVKRPPTKHIAQIAASATPFSGALVHTINKNADERFWVIVLDGDLKVFSAKTGAEVPVTFPDGKAYLDVINSPNESFRLATFNQTTVVVNREKTVGRTSELSAERGFEALVAVQQSDFDVEYRIGISFDGPFRFGFEAGETIVFGTDRSGVGVKIAPPTGEEQFPPSLSTVKIAEELAQKLRRLYGEDQVAGSRLVNVATFASTIHITPGPDLAPGAEFWVGTQDDLSNQGLQKIQESTQRIEDLPEEGPVGFRIKVEGDPAKSLDDVFFEFTEFNTWRETNQSGIPIALDPTTLPLELIHDPDLLADQFPSQVPTATFLADKATIHRAAWRETLDGTVSTREQSVITPAPGVTVDKFLDVDNGNGAAIQMRIPLTLDQTHIVGPGPSPLDPSVFYPGDVHTIEIADDTTGAFVTKFVFRVPFLSTPRKFDVDLNFGGATFSAGENVRLRIISAAGNLGALTVTTRGTSVLSTSLSVSYTIVEAQRLSLPDSHYAPGTAMTFTLNGTAFSDTFVAGGTQAAYGAALVTAIEAYGGAPAVTAVFAVKDGRGNIQITNDDGTTPALTLFTFDDNLDSTLQYFNGAADFVNLGVTVGDTLKNLTDVSEAIISVVATTIITHAALAGGTANAWAEGDKGSAETSLLSFACRQPEWAKRLVGTEETNKWPSFEDETINEVAFLKNRLVLISDENVAMSTVDEFFQFFRTSTLDVLDSDRIDVALSGNKASSLHSAFTWNETLLTWSELGQFVVNGEPFLSPNTVKREATTAYVNTRKVKPVTSERSVYFLTEGQEFTQLWDYKPTAADAMSAEGTRLSVQVPRFMPGSPRGLLAISDPEVVLVLTATDPEKLYVFSHLSEDQTRILGGFHEWSFPGVTQILGIGSIDNEVSLVFERDDGSVHIEVLDLWELSEATVDSQTTNGDPAVPPVFDPSPLTVRTQDTFTEAADSKLSDHVAAPISAGPWLVPTLQDSIGPAGTNIWLDGAADKIRAFDAAASSVPMCRPNFADPFLAGGGSDLVVSHDLSWSAHQSVEGHLGVHLKAGRDDLEAGLRLRVKTLSSSTVSVLLDASNVTGATNSITPPTSDEVGGIITVTASRAHAGGDVTAEERYGIRVVGDIVTVFVADAVTGANESTIYTGTLTAAWKTKFRDGTYSFAGLRPSATQFQTSFHDNFIFASGGAIPVTTYTTVLGDAAFPVVIGVEADGTETVLTNNGDGTVSFPGEDKTGVNIQIGLPITSTIKLTRLYHRKDFGPFSGRAEVRGSTYIQSLMLFLEETATMSIAVDITGHASFIQDLTEVRSLDAESMHVQVGGRNTEVSLTLTHSTADNFKIVGLEWEGSHYFRTRRTS